MKRLLFVCLLLVLPLQMSGAAVSGYCRHESGEATQHFAHHAHAHKAADRNDSGSDRFATFDADCWFCHLGEAGVVTSPVIVPSSISIAMAVKPSDDRLLSVFPARPERPKWATAV